MERIMSNFYVTMANGEEFPSKKAFREYVAEYPNDVRVEDTSAFNNRGVSFGVSELTPSDVVVGPNPWWPAWYANVQTSKTGGFKVI
jgi:hypothetical protein